MFPGYRLLNYLTRLPVSKRGISMCCCKYKDYSGREAKFMNKLMSGKPVKKKFYQDDKASRSVAAVINDPSSKRSTPKRVVVLNKLLMTSITDMLATGDDAASLVGRGMEVTGVSVNKDYQQVKVFWWAKSKEDELWLENELPKISHSLRHQLSQLHVLGNVPRIQFFLDTRSSRLAVIDSLISSSDKGPPDEQSEETVPSTDDLPPMTHNVYGLHHDVILKSMMKSLNKAKAPHRQKTVSPSLDPCPPSAAITSKYTQKEAIRKFLLQRRLNREKLRANSNDRRVEEDLIDDQLYDDDLNQEQSTFPYR